jgi:hypothetical protein
MWVFMAKVLPVIVELVASAFAAIYLGLVLTSYRDEGHHSRPRWNSAEPARSTERLLIWLGVKLLALYIHLLLEFYNLLADISADLGDYYVRRHPQGKMAEIRSRFL